MATIMIYEPNEIIAQKLCDSLKKEKYNAIRCDENVIPSFSDDSIPLVMMDAQLRWTTCRPLLEVFQKHGCPILFLTGDRKMSAHLRALYGGPDHLARRERSKPAGDGRAAESTATERLNAALQ